MKLNEILHEALGADSDERKVLYNFYTKSLNEVLEAKSMLEAKEKELRSKIEKYGSDLEEPKNSDVVIDNRYIAYPSTGSWAEKIDYVLYHTSNLTAREVAIEIERLQPELKGKSVSSVSPTLTDNVAKGKRYVKTPDSVTGIHRYSLK